MLPAHGGRTPREAVRNGISRLDVVRLLEEQEDMHFGNPDMDDVGWSAPYRELGLKYVGYSAPLSDDDSL